VRRPGKVWLLAAALLGLALVLGAIAPPDAVQGDSQRLMYVHVPAALCAYLCFFLVLAGSLWSLRRTPNPGAGRLAQAAAETGVVLTLLTLGTGSLWGSMAWGTWWVWDARLTSTLAMALIYTCYLAGRSLATGPRGRRLVAAGGIAGFMIVPVVHFSVLWWRTLHQPPTLLAPSLDPPIDGRMGAALAAALAAGVVLTLCVLRARFRYLAGHHEDGDSEFGQIPAHSGQRAGLRL
jgi:heme exporter protein C